jgi:hypothetical protein
MFSPFHNYGHSDDSERVGHIHNEKEFVVATEAVDARFEPDMVSDINPGELTFEEGQSLPQSCQETSLTCDLDTAGGMGRHMGVFSCTMLKYALTSLQPPITIHYFSRYVQRWSHHRHWYIRHPIVHPRVSWVRRCITDALGPWLRILNLRALCLA